MRGTLHCNIQVYHVNGRMVLDICEHFSESLFIYFSNTRAKSRSLQPSDATLTYHSFRAPTFEAGSPKTRMVMYPYTYVVMYTYSGPHER